MDKYDKINAKAKQVYEDQTSNKGVSVNRVKAEKPVENKTEKKAIVEKRSSHFDVSRIPEVKKANSNVK